jgi:hypothetical protein
MDEEKEECKCKCNPALDCKDCECNDDCKCNFSTLECDRTLM